MKAAGTIPVNASISTINSKSQLFSYTQPQNEDNIGLSQSLKTWKVNQFNDDFNRISKEYKKSYYRGQLNNKYDSKQQTAYFTTDGKYGFFSSKTEETLSSQHKLEIPESEYQTT